MSTRRVVLVVAVAVAAAVAGCDSATDSVTERAVAELTPTTSTTQPASTAPRCGPDEDPPPTYRPLEAPPPPGAMPTGSTMSAIQANGALRVGVDENTKYFSARASDSPTLVGFEADLAREISEAIFGDQRDVAFTTVVTDEKLKVVEEGTVDLTIDAVTITCDRWKLVDFSSPYYTTSQAILAPRDAQIDGIDDLDGKPVCVTAGSSSERYLEQHAPAVEIVPVAARTDCLVALQEGDVDAIFLPRSILFGLSEQDPTTALVDGPTEPQSYGIAIPKEEDDLVRFVNALLVRWRADGTLDEIQQSLAPDLRTTTTPTEPEYRD